MLNDKYLENLKQMARELEPLVKGYKEESKRGIRDGEQREALLNFFKENSKGINLMESF